jgi:hypothetical protein
VEHYHNNGYSPSLLDSMNPSLGITKESLSLSNGNALCSFTRENSNSNKLYFDLNADSPYLIAARGALSGSGGKL